MHVHQQRMHAVQQIADGAVSVRLALILVAGEIN
jgi:hypothetical protein